MFMCADDVWLDAIKDIPRDFARIYTEWMMLEEQWDELVLFSRGFPLGCLHDVTRRKIIEVHDDGLGSGQKGG